jgi:hypothetical protein
MFHSSEAMLVAQTPVLVTQTQIQVPRKRKTLSLDGLNIIMSRSSVTIELIEDDPVEPLVETDPHKLPWVDITEEQAIKLTAW